MAAYPRDVANKVIAEIKGALQHEVIIGRLFGKEIKNDDNCGNGVIWQLLSSPD
jgi:hypothetical protein